MRIPQHRKRRQNENRGGVGQEKISAGLDTVDMLCSSWRWGREPRNETQKREEVIGMTKKEIAEARLRRHVAETAALYEALKGVDAQVALPVLRDLIVFQAGETKGFAAAAAMGLDK